MRRVLLIVCLALLGSLPIPVSAERAQPISDAGDLCTVEYQIRHPGECPLYGPGGHAERNRRYDLPPELPPLATRPLDSTNPLLHKTYAKVTTPDAPVFASPQDGVKGVIKRTLGKGYIFVSLNNVTQLDGQEFVRINNGEYVRRGDLSLVGAPEYQGLAPAAQPQQPFAWVVRPFQPRLTPGGPENPAIKTLARYDIVQIYGAEQRGEAVWYLIGNTQWVEQRNLGVVEKQAPPAGVAGKWVSVNLFEQTLAAYEGSRMVYAALVSSGLGAWPTRPGLFQVYKKLDQSDMSGAFAADKSDFYFIEDVPYVLYFDDSISFHGTYWHNKFGFQQSHGCVNLSPKDARWLYDWAGVGTTVYVYDPTGRTPTAPWTGGGP